MSAQSSPGGKCYILNIYMCICVAQDQNPQSEEINNKTTEQISNLNWSIWTLVIKALRRKNWYNIFCNLLLKSRSLFFLKKKKGLRGLANNSFFGRHLQLNMPLAVVLEIKMVLAVFKWPPCVCKLQQSFEIPVLSITESEECLCFHPPANKSPTISAPQISAHSVSTLIVKLTHQSAVTALKVTPFLLSPRSHCLLSASQLPDSSDSRFYKVQRTIYLIFSSNSISSLSACNSPACLSTYILVYTLWSRPASLWTWPESYSRLGRCIGVSAWHCCVQ